MLHVNAKKSGRTIFFCGIMSYTLCRMVLEGNFRKIALSLVIILLMMSAFLGILHGGTTSIMQMGGQETCPFMPGVVICNMTPLQHIAAAQAMFNALPLPAVNFSSLLLLLFALAVGFSPFLRQSLFPPAESSIRPVSNRARIPTHNALQELFASGILNPKVF